MKGYLLGVLLFVLAACGSIPQDTTTPPMDANLFSLEMASCNKRDVGILGCVNNPEEFLEIPVVFGGEYQIQSERCNYYENKTYGGTQTLRFSFAKLMEGKPETDQSCIFDIKVFVSGMDKGLRGQFIIANETAKWAKFKAFKQDFQGLGWVQIKEGTDLQNKIDFDLQNPGLIFWEGCLKKGEKRYAKNPSIALSEIFNTYATMKDSCVLNVGIIPNDIHEEVQFAKFSINVFEKTAISLPQPIIEKDGNYLKVEADSVVAGIGIGDEFKLRKGKGSKKFKAKVDHDAETFVRIITANGRYMLLKVKNGAVIWNNFIQW